MLFGTPSLAYALWERGLLRHVAAMVIGGEPSSRALRELLSGGGQRLVVEAYGLSEVLGPGVAQSGPCGALRLNEDAFGVEVLDEGDDCDDRDEECDEDERDDWDEEECDECMVDMRMIVMLNPATT